ncbi:MAG: hypothetical protein ACYS0I_10495 [Planctomycetota bacterium]|jgi:hypothetical protein
MSECEGIKQAKEGMNMAVFVFFCCLIGLVLIMGYMFGFFNKGELVDSDCYMHLIRASDLYNYGQWYDPVWNKSNAPFGEPLHWSRPFDVLLLLGAVPGSFFVDFETALWGWGVALSPVLLVLALIALNWATRVILNKDGTFLVIFLFLFQWMVLIFFRPARPDHHGLLLLFFILNIGFVLRLIVKPFKKSLCYWAGAMSAMSIWISVESMVPTCVTMSILGFLWALKEEDFLRKSTHYAMGLFVFCFFFLALERPFHDLTIVKFDSISIVYTSILGFIALFWITASGVKNATVLLKRKIGRLTYGVLGAAFIAFVTGVLFPKLYNGPFANVDPRIITVWFNKTKEVQPLISSSVPLGISVQLIGSAIVSFSFLAYMLFRRKDTVNRNAWMCIAVSAVLLFSISLYQVRWGIYPCALFSIVMTELLCQLRKYRKEQGTVLWRTIRNSVMTLFFAMGFLYAGELAEKMTGRSGTGKNLQKPSMTQICGFLDDLQVSGTRALQIMSNPFDGAEILYRTDCKVVPTANTYGQGMLDTYDVLTAETDDVAFEILQKLRTDMILLCPTSMESVMYKKPGQTSTFYQRLCDGKIPPWLKKAQLPDELSSSFFLFEVRYDN